MREQATNQFAQRYPQLRARLGPQSHPYLRPVSADIDVGMREACPLSADGGHTRSPVRDDPQASIIGSLFQANPGQRGLGIQDHMQL
jgi:hypothetical protein